jgi:ABC-2 type transport system ATP-binding protein
MGEVELTADHLLVIDRGRLVWDGAVVDLKNRFQRTRTLTVDFERDPGAVRLNGAELVKDDGRRKTFRYDRATTGAPALLTALVGGYGDYGIADTAIAEPSIEDVIRALYLDLNRGRAAEAASAELQELDTWSRGQAVTR